MEFNQELITALAHGDKTAYETIKDLPSVTRVSIGLEVDKLREEKGIVPSSTGFSVYGEPKKSSYSDPEEIGKILVANIQAEKEREEAQEKAKRDHLRKVVEYRVQRSRAGLNY
ncbi:hypothetical protein [Priestia megaterium]|uniref:hypothetical protein n=1 Tax=Priestia megaterium TaxID=1404 RepID=UPI002FFEDB06